MWVIRQAAEHGGGGPVGRMVGAHSSTSVAVGPPKVWFGQGEQAGSSGERWTVVISAGWHMVHVCITG